MCGALWVGGAPSWRIIHISHLPRPLSMFSVPEETPLTDPSTLMKNLLAGAATFRGYPDGAGTARLLEAAAHALQQQVAETKVQRGLAIASQTLASELSVKCERMQARLELASGNGYAAPALLHDGHLRGAEVTPAVGPAATPSLATPSACAYGADMAPPSAAHMHSGHPMPSCAACRLKPQTIRLAPNLCH